MSRMSYVQGQPKPPSNIYSQYKNDIHFRYVEVYSTDGQMVCNYIVPLYIEKTRPLWASDGSNLTWHIRDGWEAGYSTCVDCFRMGEEFGHGGDVIKVDNSHDMLPLYMKWALRLGGAKFDKDGWIDDASYGENGEKLQATLNNLYQNINGKYRLKNFSECKCDKCKKEWIVFADNEVDWT